MAEYLKLPEIARRLDVSEKTARRYVKSGALPSVFIGNAYRVSEADLEEYLRGARVKPEAGSPKASAPSSHPSEKANGARDELEERLALIQEYRTRLQAAFEGLDERLKELRKTHDRKALSSLSTLAFLAYIGADAFLEDDEDLQEYEDETPEELEARAGLMRTFQRLGDLSDEIDEELDAQEEQSQVSSLDEKRRERMRRRRAS